MAQGVWWPQLSLGALKAAGPTELWGVGCEESILGNGMFQSRGVMSKWLMDTGRRQRGAGPWSHVTVLTGCRHMLWTLVRAKRPGQGTGWAAGRPQQGEEHSLWFCVPGATPSDRLGTRGRCPICFPGVGEQQPVSVGICAC